VHCALGKENKVRNKYKGICYICGKEVLPNAGHFERNKGSWRTIHVECVFKQRKKKDKKRD